MGRKSNTSFELKIATIEAYERNEGSIKTISEYFRVSARMSTRDIQEQIKDLYDIDISSELVSKISEKILPEVNEWQNRPLE